MKLAKKVTRITNIQLTGRTGGIQGNFIINRKTDAAGAVLPDCWFSSREVRNSLLGAGLSSTLPCVWLVGCSLAHEVLTIEQSDIDAAKAAGKAGFEYKLAGRQEPVVYKQAGVHNINATLDMGSMPMDKLLQISKLSMEFRTRPASLAAASAPAPLEPTDETAENIIDDEIQNTTDETGNENVEHENITEQPEEEVMEPAEEVKPPLKPVPKKKTP